MKKRVTLSLDSDVYDKFQEYCKENDIVASKRIERLISNELNEKDNGGKNAKR